MGRVDQVVAVAVGRDAECDVVWMVAGRTHGLGGCRAVMQCRRGVVGDVWCMCGWWSSVWTCAVGCWVRGRLDGGWGTGCGWGVVVVVGGVECRGGTARRRDEVGWGDVEVKRRVDMFVELRVGACV